MIRILIKDALQTLNIPITWSIFRDLLAEDDIKALTYDVSPSVSEEEAKQEKEDTELDGDEMDEEETNKKGHDEAEEKEDDAEIENKEQQEAI